MQETRQKQKKKKRKMLALKKYTLVYIVIFDNSVSFDQDNRLVVVCDIDK